MNNPLTDCYDPANAAALCRASADAYDPPEDAGDIVIHDPNLQALCAISQAGSDSIVAFRGTNNLRNWLTDIDVNFIRFSNGVRLHAGFLAALESIRGEITTAVFGVGFKSRRLWITGHSLGGAMAALYAWLTAEEMGFNPFAGVYTFGQPRVGNGRFADSYDARLWRNTFRVTHADDIVPRIPWLLGGYRHAGHDVFYPFSSPAGRGRGEGASLPSLDLPWPRKLLLDLPGLIKEATHGRLEFLDNHHINNYLALYGNQTNQ